MNYNSEDASFFNRDRFILSAGHGSSLLYSTLHLFSFNVTMDDLKQFRQYKSITPGHPEVHITSGVETSTGPLGQGVANAVGMAIAEKHMQALYNTKDIKLIDNQIYCLVSDGDLMEGVGLEAFSLAGHLKLDNLTFIYDSNDITLEGGTSLSFTDDTAKKFEAMGYYVEQVLDGNNLDDIEQKLLLAKQQTQKPSLVIVKTVIGYASPLEGTEKAHGKPLSKQEIVVLKQNLNFEHTPFTVDSDVLEYVSLKHKQNKKYYENWLNLKEQYKQQNVSLYEQFEKIFTNEYETLAIEKLKKLKIDSKLSMREIASTILQELKLLLPQIIGGTADVAPSTKAAFNNLGSFSSSNYSGKNIHYGVREHAMASIANGICLYGGQKTFVSTYFAFTDYMRAGIRMSAIMKLPILYFITHDSVLIGEDGATHQPVEQLVGFRAMPNINVFRPCNAEETLAAFITYLESKVPTLLVLSKSNINAKESTVKDSLRGGYILSKSTKKPSLILIATGSEVEVCLTAQEQLEQMGIGTQVVSMPCMELFDKEDEKYKNKVLPKRLQKRIAVEAGSAYSFYKYVGVNGKIISVDSFGGSGKPEDLKNAFLLTPNHVVDVAKKMFEK
jgi:transketolase